MEKGLNHYKFKCGAGIGLLLVLMVVFKLCIPLIPCLELGKSPISLEQTPSDEKKAEAETGKDELKGCALNLHSHPLCLNSDQNLNNSTVHRIQYTMVYCLEVIIPPPDRSLTFA